MAEKPVFQRRHYEFIANVIAGIVSLGERRRVSTRFADAFEGTNRLFNRERFLEACLHEDKAVS